MSSKTAAVFSLLIPLALFAATREGQELIGTPAPAFNLDHWVNSSPLELSDLKGKVLLVRWWTDTCELCAATAPALRKLQDARFPLPSKVFEGGSYSVGDLLERHALSLMVRL